MSWFETDAIEGYRPFYCHVCGRKLALDLWLGDEGRIMLKCQRCNTRITIERTDGKSITEAVRVMCL